jgi:hypothetical protein
MFQTRMDRFPDGAKEKLVVQRGNIRPAHSCQFGIKEGQKTLSIAIATA